MLVIFYIIVVEYVIEANVLQLNKDAHISYPSFLLVLLFSISQFKIMSQIKMYSQIIRIYEFSKKNLNNKLS